MIEQQYAGALVLRPDLYWRHQTKPEDFLDQKAKRIVESVAELLRSGDSVDVVTVAEKSGLKLGAVADYAQSVVSTTAAVSAARSIREAAERRRAIAACQDAIREIESGGSPQQALSDAQEQMLGGDSQSVTLEDAYGIYESRGSKERCLITPIPKLNDLLPIDGGKLVVIAGRPGTFKSAFALHVARYSALRDRPVGIISLEMSEWEIAGRAIKQADGKEKIPLYLNCKAFALDAIETQLIEWSERDGVKGVVIDYLGLIHFAGSKQQRRDEIIGAITRRLKLLAMRLDIPILLLAQLNRENEKHNRRPILSDLRESGNIEQDADAVIFLHRNTKNEKESYELILAKHRGGPTGFVDLHIDKAKFRIHEATR